MPEDNKEINEELRFIHSEFTRNIDFIKKRMLIFLYYTLSLQAGIIAYHKLIAHENEYYLDNIFLALISFIVASVATYFIKKYQRDYWYRLYLCSIYIDPEFSNKAKRSFDVPSFFIRETVDMTMDDYFNFSKKDLFINLYLLFNWGVCFLVIIYLIIHKNALGEFAKPIIWVIVIGIFWGVTKFISHILAKETKKKLCKHQKYVSILESCPNINIADMKMEKKLNE